VPWNWTATVSTFPSWPFGKLGEFTVSLSLGVSVFTLTALSAVRVKTDTPRDSDTVNSPSLQTSSPNGHDGNV